MSADSKAAGDPPEPAGSPENEAILDDGEDVFRGPAAHALVSDVDEYPRAAITDESGPAVRGEWHMPEVVPAERPAIDFDEFYLTQFDRLVAAARRFCNNDFHLAEDVVQRTFMKICQRPRELEKKRNPYGWVLSIAFHVAVDIFRTEGVRATREHDREMLRVQTDEWEGRTWMIALQQLPEPDRQVMFCRFVLHYDRQQTADELDMSLRSVENHTARALRKLRKCVKTDEEG